VGPFHVSYIGIPNDAVIGTLNDGQHPSPFVPMYTTPVEWPARLTVDRPPAQHMFPTRSLFVHGVNRCSMNGTAMFQPSPTAED
jgi:hypothetical protein